MKHCVVCDKRFENEDRFTVCQDCYEDGAIDGSEEQWRLARHLFELRHHVWTLEDKKFVSDSAAGAWIAELIIENMDLDCAVNLLKRMIKHRES